MPRQLSIRSTLIGGILALAAIVTVIIGIVGAIGINRSVLHEAQERVNHDLDTISALYQLNARMLGNQIQGWTDSLEATGGPEATERLLQIKRETRISILNMCHPSGRPLAGAYPDANAHVPTDADPVLRQALQGTVAWGTILLDESRLRMEGYPSVGESLVVRSDQDGGGTTNAALFQWFAYPMCGTDGRVQAIVYGGRTLDRNHALVDTMRDIAFGTDLYQGKPRGTVTIFLDDTRVATNVLTPDGGRAEGTIVSREVYQTVIQEDRRWQGPAWVVDAWYLSGYKPLKDPDGRTVGMLYVGLLRSPYDALRSRLLMEFLIPAGVVLVLGVVITVFVVRRITRPLDSLRNSAQRIADGDWNGDIPVEHTYLEVATLVDVFRRMQGAIRQRDQQLQHQNIELTGTNERLEQTNSNYMKTLRFVTHELKSPLATIQTMIDVVVSNLMGEVPEKVRHPLIRIKRNCEELQDMIRNYLDLARAERDELQANKRKINFHQEVVQPTVEQNLPLFRSRQMELGVECSPDLTVVADPELMRIALSNYLSNAAKYGREGGKAEIAVAQVEEAIEVRVWNEGLGFSSDEGQSLFGKFSRLHNENTRGKRGSGLGLYLCKQILDLHGGTVWAESKSGSWARFCFRLPLFQQ